MKDLIAKLEALKGKPYSFYDDGVQDCIKIVEKHKTRQAIQVTEGEFEEISQYSYSFKKYNFEMYIGEFYSDGEYKKIIQIFKNKAMQCEEYYKGDILKDGVIAVNEALKKMFEDVSEERKDV